MTAGGGVTYPRVVELLKAEVEKKGQRGAAAAVKIALLSLQRYIKGKGEPTQASLQKIADYFGVSVPYLRGESAIIHLRNSGEPLNEKNIDRAYELNVMESVLAFEAGKRKYPELWEVFQSIPLDKQEEALAVLKGYWNLSVAARKLLDERADGQPDTSAPVGSFASTGMRDYVTEQNKKKRA